MTQKPVQAEAEGVSFAVRIQPRASKNEVAGVLGAEIKIRITAPPVDGEANKALCVFLGRLLGVPTRRVEIVTGHKGRRKVIRVAGISAAEAMRKLNLT